MTPDAPPAPSPGGRLLVGAAIVLLAVNLRAAIGSLGVVLGSVRGDLGMSTAVAGILTTVPVVCFAVFGIGSHSLVKKLGLHRTAVLTLVMLTAGLALRSSTDSSALFMVWTAVALAGGAVGNIILPPLVKVHFPDRIGLLSALYGAALMVGASISSLVTVPLSDLLGTWRQGLGLWAVLAAVSLLPWLAFLRHDVRTDPLSERPLDLRDLVRSRLAWMMVLCFAAQSGGAYAQFGWFPEILTDTGLSQARAGAMLGVLTGVMIPLTLALPWLMRLAGDRPILPYFFTAVSLCGWLGVLLAPTTMTWLWATLLGLGGGAFTWQLTMIGQRSRTAAGTTALSVTTQGIGYLLAAVGPLGTGILHDLTGSWTVPIIALMGLSCFVAVFGRIIVRPVMLEDTIDTRR